MDEGRSLDNIRAPCPAPCGRSGGSIGSSGFSGPASTSSPGTTATSTSYSRWDASPGGLLRSGAGDGGDTPGAGGVAGDPRALPQRPVPGNLLDTGERVYVIDWEYSGMNDPVWDLADLSVEAGLGLEQ